MHSEGSCFITSGRHHTAHSNTTDDDRLTAQRRLVALLDRGIEGIQVEMQNDPISAHISFRVRFALAAGGRWLSDAQRLS